MPCFDVHAVAERFKKLYTCFFQLNKITRIIDMPKCIRLPKPDVYWKFMHIVPLLTLHLLCVVFIPSLACLPSKLALLYFLRYTSERFIVRVARLAVTLIHNIISYIKP